MSGNAHIAVSSPVHRRSRKRSLDSSQRRVQSVFQRHSEVEMSNTEMSDHQLLDKAKTAIHEKDGERAKVLFAEFSERSVARNKAKVANDPA
jgi:hypothetical protein